MEIQARPILLVREILAMATLETGIPVRELRRRLL
jgi:hypothetical protein